MNSAHASLLQWLQTQPTVATLRIIPPTPASPFWLVSVRNREGIGDSYDDACYDLLQRLKK